MSYDIRSFNYDYYHVWNLIVGVQYVTVGTTGHDLNAMIEALAEEIEIKKPFVVISFNQMRSAEYRLIQDHGIFDYEFGVE